MRLLTSISKATVPLFLILMIAACTRENSKIDSEFTAGIVLSQAKSELSVSSNTVVAGDSVQVTFTTRDQNGAIYISANPLAVTFAIRGGTSLGTFGTVIDKGDGTYTTTFTGLSAGTTTSLHATVAGQDVIGTYPSLTVHAGAFSLSKSVLTTAATTVTSGATTVVKLEIRDSSNNPLSAGGLNVGFAYSSGTSTGTFSATTDNGDGTYTAIFTGVLAGTAKTLIATIGGVAVTNTAPTITVTHGAASNLVYTTQPSGAVVATVFTSQPVVEVRDAAGNKVTTGVDSTAVLTMTLTTGSGSLSGTAAATAVAGVATWNTLKVDTAGAKILTVTKPDLSSSGGTASLSKASSSFTAVTDPPTVPTGLSTSLADSSISLSWGAVTGATSYNVLRGTATGVLTVLATPTTNSYVDSSAVNGTTYYYAVQSARASGTSVSSAEVQARAIANFTMTAVTPGLSSTTVTWASAVGTSTYDILYDTVSRASSGTYASSVTGVSSGAGVGSLTAGTTYHFRVRANGIGGSVLSTNEISSAVYQNYALNIPYTAGTESSYLFNDLSYSTSMFVDLVGNVARLKPAPQTDNTGNSFGSATYSGVFYYSTNSTIRLNTSTNGSNLDLTWAPQWSTLTGYWPFDGALGAIANSASITATVGSAGSASNAGGTGLAYVAGQLTNAIQFDGTDDFAALGNYGTELTNYTVAMWLKPSAGSSATQQYVLMRGDATSCFYNPAIAFTPSTSTLIVAESGCGGTGRVGTGYVIDRTIWNHLVITRSGQTVNVYLNGLLVSTDTSQPAGGGAGRFRIGVSYGSGQSDTGFFAGAVDDVATWSTALLDTEVTALYARQASKYSGLLTSRIMTTFGSAVSWKSIAATTTLPFGKEISATNESSTDYSDIDTTGLATNLAGLWHMNEVSWNGTLNEVVDSSGSLNHGYTTGGMTTTLKGKFARAGFFGASNSTSIVTARSDSLIASNNHAVSMAAWIRPTGVSGNGSSRIFSFLNTGGTSSVLSFLLNPNYTIGFYNAADALQANGTTVLNLMRWTHVALTYNGTCFQMYVDGVAEGACLTKPLNAAGTGKMRIGSFDSSAYEFIGTIDEAAVWTRSLSSTEILQIYQRGAVRVKYQVRSCANSGCSDQELLTTAGKGWKGPDNTQQTYFSELHNNTVINSGANGSGAVNAGPLSLQFSSFSSVLPVPVAITDNPFFQYRMILESDDNGSRCTLNSSATVCSPVVTAVTAGPNHYTTTVQTVTSKASIGSAFEKIDASGFSPTGVTCTQVARYTVSRDGTTFYYWSGTAWASSSNTYATASIGSDITSNIDTFPTAVGTGTLQVKTFLKSDGLTACEVDNLLFNVKKF